MNAMQAIHPYKHAGLWVFDDPDVRNLSDSRIRQNGWWMLAERPKVSDRARGTRGLQRERDGRVRSAREAR
jgi:hypothetical protein